jgi:hypothetical protein
MAAFKIPHPGAANVTPETQNTSCCQIPRDCPPPQGENIDRCITAKTKPDPTSLHFARTQRLYRIRYLLAC